MKTVFLNQDSHESVKTFYPFRNKQTQKMRQKKWKERNLKQFLHARSVWHVMQEQLFVTTFHSIKINLLFVFDNSTRKDLLYVHIIILQI